MIILRISTLLAAFAFAGQTPQPSPPALPNIYAPFLGTWTGSDHFFQKGKWVDLDLNLKITADKRGMRWDYHYAKSNNPGAEKLTRFVTLDSGAKKVVLQWAHEKFERYLAVDLAELAQRGSGTFVLDACAQYPSGSSAKATFKIEKDFLTYQWGSCGDPEVVNAIWKLYRTGP